MTQLFGQGEADAFLPHHEGGGTPKVDPSVVGDDLANFSADEGHGGLSEPPLGVSDKDEEDDKPDAGSREGEPTDEEQEEPDQT
ncbi:MAG: hypothetical protein COV60_02715 [Candidatus Magasanikbacteria bacterium CG11_big_fil_rev_8_21_14_0_20_43_7]|uniref:Uncharacterized protein n=1 Tax=Candidatus Magasanikbacteria bacterium CG11_big_fil_rev_8_21_14_0_20_43_7 TaxID=1974654 RepID=A0A2H0N266_9BACT|nr:MAG: hypothetical protein COV60_02715 [Candidatus Magasanikbacteria bacterium CG11_big_fil_rev_8_21_14_0_20_43_7]